MFMPDWDRNFWKSAGLGNCWLLIMLNCFVTSFWETLTPWSEASPVIQSAEIKNCMTWSRRLLYSCSHWALNCASLGAGWPLAGLGAVWRLLAMHPAKVGGSGTTGLAVWPGTAAAEEAAATTIQWSKSRLVTT